jgi:hypothetical protein
MAGGANGGHRATRSPWVRTEPAPLGPRVRSNSRAVDGRSDRFDLPGVDRSTIDLIDDPRAGQGGSWRLPMPRRPDRGGRPPRRQAEHERAPTRAEFEQRPGLRAFRCRAPRPTLLRSSRKRNSVQGCPHSGFRVTSPTGSRRSARRYVSHGVMGMVEGWNIRANVVLRAVPPGPVPRLGLLLPTTLRFCDGRRGSLDYR